MDWSSLAPRIAAELEAMARATEALATSLCADEAAARHCLPLLQEFDLLAQQQAELGALIARLGEGGQGEQALQEVRLSALADRLRAAA